MKALSFFNRSANSEQLDVLSQAFERYCHTHGITDAEKRDDIASIVMDLYNRGMSNVDEILATLEKIAADNERRRA